MTINLHAMTNEQLTALEKVINRVMCRSFNIHGGKRSNVRKTSMTLEYNVNFVLCSPLTLSMEIDRILAHIYESEKMTYFMKA